MARGRMLNKKVSASIQFDNLPDDTCRLLATWTIAHLDVNGVFYADAAVVRSLVFTRRYDVTIEQIETYLQTMERVGLIIRYEAEGQMWQQWPEFRANQPGLRADRETAEFPTPDQAALEQARQDDGKLPEECRQDDGETPAEVKLSEVKLSEGNTNGADAPAEPPPSNLDGWLEVVREAKNKQAALRFMHVTLYPKHEPPEYSYLGRTARTVGGAGRLATLLWQSQTQRVDGDVLRYCMAMAKPRASPSGRGSNLESSLAAARSFFEGSENGDTARDSEDSWGFSDSISEVPT